MANRSALLVALPLFWSLALAADSAAGNYALVGVREVGSELLLKDDGTFEFMLAYGALDRLAQGTWRQEGDSTGEGYREKWALFLVCPFCAGFWIALAWWGAWLVWPHATLIAATPFVINAGVIAAQRILSSE